MTSGKAVAGAIATNAAIVLMYFISLIPGWDTMPMEPKAALSSLILTAMGFCVVYFSPPNSHKVKAPAWTRPADAGL